LHFCVYLTELTENN